MSQPPGFDPESADFDDRPRELSSRGRVWFTVAWCSFLAASVATMVFFAIVDPAPYAGAAADDGPARMTLYGVGFFFFWAICASAAALTAFMLTTAIPASPVPRDSAAGRSPN